MRKFLKRLGLTILVVLLILVAAIFITGKTYLFKAAWYYTADIDDYKIFENNIVQTGRPQPWMKSANYNKIVYPESLDQKLAKYKTVALAVIRNDSLLFEKYWSGYSDTSRSGSFSVAKSITSLLIGAALKEGKIKSLDQHVSDFIPEFKEGLKAKLSIKHLLTMSSGSNWNESYSDPFSVTTEAYYGKDLYKTATSVKIIKEPGTYHLYQSGNTQLLGLILEKATGKTLSEYASEKIWQPVGAEHPALWSTDKKGGYEKAYCCFNSNVRDFARIGQLMLDSGKWKGVPIIDSAYWRASITPCMINDEYGQATNYYGYHWWILPDHPDIFYGWGILGQYIVVIPSRKTVIVRLGEISGGHHTPNSAEMVYWLVDWANEF